MVYTNIDLTIVSKEINMTPNFSALKINPALIEALKKQGITSPTPIQELTFPAFSEGVDLLMESHTGSGKTLAFLLPLFEKIDTEKREMQAIILAPTHELVMQIHEQINLLAKNSNFSIKSCPIMGEVNIDSQIKRLREKPQIIVGTAGRILDLMLKKKITASTIQTVILDEADHLLDQNQANTIKKMLHLLSESTQICLCSASMSSQSTEAVKSFMSAPTVIRTSNKTVLNPNIKHFCLVTEQREKFDMLKKLLLATHTQKALIFVSQNTNTTSLVDKLNYHGHSVATISGKLTKEERKAALTAFKTGKVKLLISSDLSARGLDVPDITHVIHFDFPLTPHDYLHRAGRSARGFKDGYSICLATPKDLGAIRIFEREFNMSIAPIKLIKGQVRDAHTGEVVATSPTTSKKQAAEVTTSKKRNKYPKGFNATKKEKNETMPSATKLTSSKNKSSIDDNLFQTDTGTLADALALIAQDEYGKDYE